MGGEVKVQGYSFSLTAKVVVGRPQRIDVALCPLVRLEARRVVTNVVDFGVVHLHGAFCEGRVIGKTDNVDAYYLSTPHEESYYGIADLEGLPTMLKKKVPLRGPVRMMAHYTGSVPRGLKVGLEWMFCLSFQGPAKVLERRAVA